MRAGVPSCPRHDEPLINAGTRPPAIAMALLVDGSVRHRFVVRAGRPITVGRSPDDPNGLMLGDFVTGDAAAMISRNHAIVELREDTVLVTDVSTNGTLVRTRKGPYTTTGEVPLTNGAPYALQPWDTVVLQEGIELSRADRGLPSRVPGMPGSVMGDAPTIAFRPPQ